MLSHRHAFSSKTVSLRNRSRCLRFTEKHIHRDGYRTLRCGLIITHSRLSRSSQRSAPQLDECYESAQVAANWLGGSTANRQEWGWGSLRFLLAARLFPACAKRERGLRGWGGERGGGVERERERGGERLRNRPRIAERRAHARRLISSRSSRRHAER